MAKGDAGSPQQAQAPKMDQYSVMHGIMDRLGQAGGSIAPSQMPQAAMQPRIGTGGQFGGRMGGGAGVTPFGMGSMQVGPQNSLPMGSIGPQGPDVVTPDYLRRIMMGNNVG